MDKRIWLPIDDVILRPSGVRRYVQLFTQANTRNVALQKPRLFWREIVWAGTPRFWREVEWPAYCS